MKRIGQMSDFFKACLKKFQQINLAYKIILLNVLVSFGWALAALVDLDTFLKPLPKTFKAIALLAVGVGGSVAANFFFTRAAFSPVVELSEIMNQIAAGRFNLRGKTNPWGGPMIRRCVESLNQMLDVLESERRHAGLLANALMMAQEDERRRIARELHDETNQVLATLGIRIEQLKRKVVSSSTEFDAIEAEFLALEELTAHTLVELRRLAFNLRPTLLDNLGLRPALSWLFREHVEKHGVRVSFLWEGSDERLPKNVELALFRISQEAASNIIKHSKAANVSVHLNTVRTEMTLTIEDDGVGFDARAMHGQLPHMGIFSMQERTSLLNGEFHFKSTPGQGTRIEVQIPLESLAEKVPA